PAPTRPIRRGMAGPNLLAHILVSKFDDQLPLYRQREILARHGADIPRSTLIDWCGQSVATLRPLSEAIKRAVMNTDRLHADDTPIKVLDPARRKAGTSRGVKEGRIWSMFGTIGPGRAATRPVPPTGSRRTGRANIRSTISPTSK